MSEKTPKTVLVDIPSDKQDKRDWKVEVNGQPVAEVSRVSISNPEFGILEYGNDPAGYDRWGFHGNGGGGSVVVPYSLIEGELHIGVVEQVRVNQGGAVLNVPRGFLHAGESHFRAARREFTEETGHTPQKNDVFRFEGRPMNPNSAFFETIGPDEGVQAFGLRIHQEVLERRLDGGYRFRPGMLETAPASRDAKLAEQILGCRFVKASDALQLGDMFTVAGVGRLLGHLKFR